MMERERQQNDSLGNGYRQAKVSVDFLTNNVTVRAPPHNMDYPPTRWA